MLACLVIRGSYIFIFCIFFLQKLNPIGQALAAAHVRQFSLCGVLIILLYKIGFNKQMNETNMLHQYTRKYSSTKK